MTGEFLGNVKGWRPRCPGYSKHYGNHDATVRVTLKEEVFADGRCCFDGTHEHYDYYLVFWCGICGHVLHTSPHPDGDNAGRLVV